MAAPSAQIPIRLPDSTSVAIKPSDIENRFR
jgi:hypothetical protein